MDTPTYHLGFALQGIIPCLSFAVHSTTPATGSLQDLVGLDQAFVELLTWTFAKNECGLAFFTAIAPTSSDVPWDTVMFHSVQAAAASAPHGEFPAVHPDPRFLKHRWSTSPMDSQNSHTERQTGALHRRQGLSSAGLLMEDLSVQRGAQSTIRMRWFCTRKTLHSKLHSTERFPAAY